ncbi:fimbrial protein [Phytobacter diazotrophicus]|uniref:fimbrial protein n=1 Tax=Phytobacter diazotrophicus TaxID=395631 RepID=UPI0014516108|nr:fimbrial protein [Phytobacter diazotrophicus]MDU7134947.1 fimbrial protein [Enterobacteriaceae bacterium]QJF15559.1 type 1 fimbrial protein [Phytobacter diazotrophicus]
MCKKWILLLLLHTALWLFTVEVTASCDFSPTASLPQSQTIKTTIPLSGLNRLSVPPGTPVGQIIYRQTTTISQGGNATGVSIRCTSPGAVQHGYEYANHPWPVSGYSNTVYQTNLAGIGVRYTHNTIPLPTYTSESSCYPMATPGCGFKGLATYVYIELIKTAEPLAIGVLRGSELPVLRRSYGQAGSMVSVYEYSLGGELIINAPTCDIHPTSGSMTVLMGEHLVSKFTGVGSGTSWINAGITLNCPETFYGNSGADGTTTTAAIYTGSSTVDQSLRSNIWQLDLTPVDGVIDATSGIIAIADAQIKAEGIGIQLSRTSNVNGKINLNARIVGTIPSTGVSQITIPLFARYIQTESNVKSGKANGKLIYTISYK